jgi:hypothetical protein
MAVMFRLWSSGLKNVVLSTDNKVLEKCVTLQVHTCFHETNYSTAA